jgi:hypothetical protein
MEFKKWIEATASSKIEKASDDFFGRKFINRKIDPQFILSALGLSPNQELVVFNTTGSAAIIYEYPGDSTKLIKVTGDMNDAKAFNKLYKSNFKSPNVVGCYMVKKIAQNAAVIIVDKVDGGPMLYSTSELTAVIQGDSYDEVCSASISLMRGKPDRTRDKILIRHGKNNPQEKMKLAQLFKTLCQLKGKGIDVFDFDSNILDNGESYVIVDLGQ